MNMSARYKVYQVDAFTKAAFKGNPAGVVTNADGLTDEAMQSIARELNNSETAFIFTSNDPEYDVHTRYFTPTSEVPICGHATIASQYVWALESNHQQGLIYNKTGAGILPVEVSGLAENTKITMTQGDIEFGILLEANVREDLLLALGLEESDILGGARIQVVSTGHSKVMIPLKSTEVMNALSPDMNKLKAISRHIQCNGFYTFTMASLEEEYLIRGRMFAPAIGIEEDPVTGNANGPLGAYLVHHKMIDVEDVFFAFKALQGEAINRPGVIDVQVTVENGHPKVIKVSGYAVIVFETTLEI